MANPLGIGPDGADCEKHEKHGGQTEQCLAPVHLAGKVEMGLVLLAFRKGDDAQRGQGGQCHAGHENGRRRITLLKRGQGEEEDRRGNAAHHQIIGEGAVRIARAAQRGKGKADSHAFARARDCACAGHRAVGMGKARHHISPGDQQQRQPHSQTP